MQGAGAGEQEREGRRVLLLIGAGQTRVRGETIQKRAFWRAQAFVHFINLRTPSGSWWRCTPDREDARRGW